MDKTVTTAEAARLSVALLAVAESTASTLFGMHDLFASAGRDWPFLVAGVPGAPRISSAVVAGNTRGFAISNGVWLQPHGGLATDSVPDVVCVPEILVPPHASLEGRYGAEQEWLRWCYREGAMVAAVCSGTVLLAEAGLLDGQDATTHWGYCDAMASRYPRVRLHPERALVVTGEGQRIVLAGGGTSWQDLALYLVARHLGTEEAMQLARIYLVDWHESGQQPYASLVRARQVDDAVIRDCQAWIAQNYDQASPVAGMVARSGLLERSFKRRFLKATGLSPLEYVHTLRLEEAKQALEAGDDPVEAIAEAVGYGDPSFFNRLFRRKVGMTPAQYRRKFRTLRRTLEAAPAVGAAGFP